MRLFAAVWPPEPVLDHLDLALATVRGGPAGLSSAVRWSARETWHLTTAFYGDVPDGAVPGLRDELAAVAAATAPYELALRGAGLFTHRTLWVGVGGDTEAQRRLAAACMRAWPRAGGEPADGRARERAHLTIGRVRSGGRPPRGRPGGPGYGSRGGSSGAGAGAGAGGRRGGRRDRGRWDSPSSGDEAAGVVRALSVYEGPTWRVEAIRLVASQPGAGRGGGPLYTPVEELPLTGAAQHGPAADDAP